METLIVSLIVAVAIVYTLVKAWQLFRPRRGSTGCGCSQAKTGCSGCPLAKP